MSTRTAEELAEEIADTNTAIQALVNGDRLRSLTVGSGEFQRRYAFAEITLENLQKAKDDLQKELDALNNAATGVVFKNRMVHMSWDKGF